MKKEAKTKKAVVEPAGLDDARFTHLKSDPKFSGLSNKNKKVFLVFVLQKVQVVLEKRFAAALTDTKFSTRAPVDKRGRRQRKITGTDLLDLYEVEDDAEEPTPAKKTRTQEESDLSDEEQDDVKPVKIDLARGEGNLSSSDDSDDDESDWELPENLQVDMDLAQLDHDAEQVEWASRRLAACNLDWKIIKADDIMILVNSFKPSAGRVETISIYLSDFGKERFEEEDRYGPRLQISKPIEEIEEGDELDAETRAAVRKYQMDLLKYYYAVIECDSVETATQIYEQCDGFQFETSGLKMDLRFIPEEMEFEDDRLKERIRDQDVNLDKYKSKEKIRSGVAQTDGKVQWDENDEERVKELREVFNSDDKDVSEKVWSSYFAQSDSDDEGTATSRAKALRALLDEAGNEKDLQVEWSDKEDDRKEEVEEEEESDDDSDIDKALAKRGRDSESEEVEGEDDKSEPKTEKKKNNYKSYLEKRKLKRKERKQKLKDAKEVERDELNQVGKEAKQRLKTEKTKKCAVQPTEKTAEKVLSDDRFKALFTDSAFAIEQSAKQFKGSKLSEKQAALKKDSRLQQKKSDDLLSKLKQKTSKWEQKKQQTSKK